MKSRGRAPKLQHSDRQIILSRLACGERGKDLAIEFGVSPMTVSKIRNQNKPVKPMSLSHRKYLESVFWSKVRVEAVNECWPFHQASMEKYGHVDKTLTGDTLAHVVAYLISAPGRQRPEEIRHLCDNRSCCNPAHLCPGSRQQNMADRKHRADLVRAGHVGPTPVSNPVEPPPGGWVIVRSSPEITAAWKMEHLQEKVQVNGDGCWIWTQKSTHRFGYGQISGMPAHRYAYRWTHGELPPAPMWILHRCGVAACCNPEHLYAGTAKQNAADTTWHGRRQGGAANHNAKLTDMQARTLRKDYWEKGDSLVAVAKAAGIAPSAASRILKGTGYASAGGPIGESLRGARPRVLNSKIVSDCRKLHRAGVTVASLADRYGIHVETLRDAICGRSWKQVPESDVQKS